MPPCQPGGSPHGFGGVLPISVLFSYLQGKKRVLTSRPDSGICLVGLILFRSFILSPFYCMLAFHVNHARELSGAVIYRWNKEAEAQRRLWGASLLRAASQYQPALLIRKHQDLPATPTRSSWHFPPYGPRRHLGNSSYFQPFRCSLC